MKILFLICCLSLVTANVMGQWTLDKTPKPEYFTYSESDFWANLWVVYSFCSLDAIIKSTTAWNNVFSGYGSSTAQPSLDGLSLGLEGGWLFDGLNGISLSVENIQVAQTSYTFSTPYSNISSVIQPNVYSLSANLYHFIEQKPDSQTYVCAGVGYYLVSQSYVLNVYTIGGTLTQWDKGYWGGGVIGGTLGAGARINAGKNFGVQLEAKGRYANFTRVTTPYTDNTTHQNYISALAIDQNGVPLQEPEDQVGVGKNKDQFLDFDFSGFDLNFGVFYHF
jgi:hypothetical protein